MMHTLPWLLYFKPRVGASKRQDKPLADPNGPLSSIFPAEGIRDANGAHARSSQQILGGERKRSRGFCVKLTPVQQAHIAKYALANGNKARRALSRSNEHNNASDLT